MADEKALPKITVILLIPEESRLREQRLTAPKLQVNVWRGKHMSKFAVKFQIPRTRGKSAYFPVTNPTPAAR